MKELHKITLAKMKEEVKGKSYDVLSTDINALSISFYNTMVNVDLENRDGGEIVIHKPYTACEVKIDCEDIVDSIETDGAGYLLISFNNGMSDIEIKEVKQ